MGVNPSAGLHLERNNIHRNTIAFFNFSCFLMMASGRLWAQTGHGAACTL
jgi:hypothetical protein